MNLDHRITRLAPLVVAFLATACNETPTGVGAPVASGEVLEVAELEPDNRVFSVAVSGDRVAWWGGLLSAGREADHLRVRDLRSGAEWFLPEQTFRGSSFVFADDRLYWRSKDDSAETWVLEFGELTTDGRIRVGELARDVTCDPVAVTHRVAWCEDRELVVLDPTTGARERLVEGTEVGGLLGSGSWLAWSEGEFPDRTVRARNVDSGSERELPGVPSTAGVGVALGGTRLTWIQQAPSHVVGWDIEAGSEVFRHALFDSGPRAGLDASSRWVVWRDVAQTEGELRRRGYVHRWGAEGVELLPLQNPGTHQFEPTAGEGLIVWIEAGDNPPAVQIWALRAP